MSEEKKVDNATFESLASVQPPRSDVPDDDGNGKGGGESEENYDDFKPRKTDIEVADTRLFPDLGIEHLNVLESSRTFPDIYNPLFRILVKSLLRKSLREKGKNKINMAETIAKVNTALSISIDGEGRIDEINIMGRAMTNEEEKTKLAGG